jgi:hypothetical protein
MLSTPLVESDLTTLPRNDRRFPVPKDDDSDYPIGYGKPPKHTQFKTGQSGNPNGRPKKGTTANEIALRQLRKKFTINLDGGKTRVVSLLEAILARHSFKAAQGDVRSTTLMLELIKSVESDFGNRLPELTQEFREINARLLAAERKRNQQSQDGGPDTSE